MNLRLKTSAIEAIFQPLVVAKSLDDVGDPDVGYVPIKKSTGQDAELRYTLGPVYSPGVLDAHDEYAEAEDLRKALWDFSLHGDRTLRKQHGSRKAGDIVELVQWPYDHEAELTLPDGTVTKAKLPAGTVYLGVQWTPFEWVEVKKGRVRGYSMGGAAVRVAGDPSRELTKFTKSAIDGDGDGMVNDGTPQERPAPPRRPQARARLGADPTRGQPQNLRNNQREVRRLSRGIKTAKGRIERAQDYLRGLEDWGAEDYEPARLEELKEAETRADIEKYKAKLAELEAQAQASIALTPGVTDEARQRQRDATRSRNARRVRQR